MHSVHKRKVKCKNAAVLHRGAACTFYVIESELHHRGEKKIHAITNGINDIRVTSVTLSWDAQRVAAHT